MAGPSIFCVIFVTHWSAATPALQMTNIDGINRQNNKYTELSTCMY